MCFFCAFDGIVLLLCLKFLLENVTTNQHCCIKSLLRDTIPLFSLVNTCLSFQSEMKKNAAHHVVSESVCHFHLV